MFEMIIYMAKACEAHLADMVKYADHDNAFEYMRRQMNYGFAMFGGKVYIR